MQLLSLEHGGAIACHDDDPALSQIHKSTLRNLGRHKINIDSKSKLFNIFQRNQLKVNSLHHQHITNSGTLNVSGKSPDGLIEAVESKSNNFTLGVQWHPELLALFDYKEEKLFKSLVNAAVKRREGINYKNINTCA
jgi:putative glutamine amidotransferase